MKILVISNLYPPHALGGYEILCAQVVDYLRNQGHEVTVLTSSDDRKLPAAGARDDAAQRLLELYLPFSRPATGRHRGRRLLTGRKNLRITQSAIRRFQPDVIFIWSQLRLTVGCARAAEASGIPVVYTLNDEHLVGYRAAQKSGSSRSLVSYLLDKGPFRSSTLWGLELPSVTTISQTLKDSLVQQGLNLAHAEVLYQGIPVERFPLREQAGVLQNPAKLLYTGQLHPYKGVHVLVDAVHRMAESRQAPPVELTVVGRGEVDYEAALRDRADSGPGAIRWSGRMKHRELPAVYRAHDIFVFPSIWQEPFGLTHLEAMASGLPVVSTANGGQGEFLVDGENSLIVPPEDPAALARALTRLIRDPSLRRRLLRSGRRTVERNFSLDRYVEQLEQLLFRSIAERAAA